MKTNVILMLAILVGFTQVSYSQVNKRQNKLEEMAEKMNKKGANMVVGIGISERVDLGERKAIMNAKQQISESNKDYVMTSTEDFRGETGMGRGSETYDDFVTLVESVSAMLIEGARTHTTDSYRSKSDRKNGTYTYLVLYGVTPQMLKSMMEAEMAKRGKEDLLYQRYMKSEYKKEHDKKVQEFKEAYGSED
jgi:hypothetical protein